MADKLKILIVEDDKLMATLLAHIVDPLLQRWPDSQIIVTHTWSAALQELQSLPIPDLVLLDLSLPDSTIERTIERIGEVEDRCPLVIVTGHYSEQVKKLLKEREIEVVEKIDALSFGETLIKAIVREINYWHDRKNTRINRIRDNLNQLQVLTNGPA